MIVVPCRHVLKPPTSGVAYMKTLSTVPSALRLLNVVFPLAIVSYVFKASLPKSRNVGRNKDSRLRGYRAYLLLHICGSDPRFFRNAEQALAFSQLRVAVSLLPRMAALPQTTTHQPKRSICRRIVASQRSRRRCQTTAAAADTATFSRQPRHARDDEAKTKFRHTLEVCTLFRRVLCTGY